MRKFLKHAATVALIPLLGACGGGDGGDNPNASANPSPVMKFSSPAATVGTIRIFGDSLADSGPNGDTPYTIKNIAGAKEPTSIWPTVVANYYGVTGCKSVSSTTEQPTNTEKCINYAKGGAFISRLADTTSSLPGVLSSNGGQAQDQDGLSITQRILAVSGNVEKFKADEVILIDGGGNDLQDLLMMYLALPAAQSDYSVNGTYNANFSKYVISTFKLMLDTDALRENLKSQAALESYIKDKKIDLLSRSGLEIHGNNYMKELARTFSILITDELISKRQANNIVILNMPDVTDTPKFSLAKLTDHFKNVNEANRVKKLVATWAKSFNDELNLNLMTNYKDKVAVVDFNKNLTEMSRPIKPVVQTNQQEISKNDRGFTNVVESACKKFASPPSIDTCYTSSFLQSNTQWPTFLFADDFHPTPFGHMWIAHDVMSAIQAKNRPTGTWNPNTVPVPPPVAVVPVVPVAP